MVLLQQSFSVNRVLSTLEWFEQIIDVRQVTKVGQGKKRLSFRVVIIIGNKQGCVGIGIGKDLNLLTAKFKGIANAKKNILHIFVTASGTIPHMLIGKFKKSLIILKPAVVGAGIRAGQTIHSISELAGIRNISSKQLGSNSVINNAYAMFLALKNLSLISSISF